MLTPSVQLINDNVFEWSVALIVLNPDSVYYGGYFKAKMTFPRNYPYSPPGTYFFT
jgi:ubiquitin-conjugating enzyme E2 R